MIALAYTSTSTRPFSPKDLQAILRESRKNNAKSGITGILLYRGSTVLQVLEGEVEAVRALYAKLLLDTRHHSLFLLYDRPISQRSFSQWTMAFEHMAASDAFGDGVHRLTLTGMELSPPVPAGDRACRLLDVFLRQVR